MPAFITIPNPQPYPPVTTPCASSGIEFYMFGLRNDYFAPGVITAEALVTGPSLQYAVRSFAGSNSNAPAIQWNISYPSAPDTVEVHLEGTLDQLNGPWFQLATSTNAAGDSITVNQGTAKVVAIRTNVISAAGGTSPTIVSTGLI